jgi:hypothetical protein
MWRAWNSTVLWEASIAQVVAEVAVWPLGAEVVLMTVYN